MNRQEQINGMRATEALKPGDECEFRFPARREWFPGVVVKNGGSGFWSVRQSEGSEDYEAGSVHNSLYIEFVRAPGTDPWFL